MKAIFEQVIVEAIALLANFLLKHAKIFQIVPF